MIAAADRVAVVAVVVLLTVAVMNVVRAVKNVVVASAATPLTAARMNAARVKTVVPPAAAATHPAVVPSVVMLLTRHVVMGQRNALIFIRICVVAGKFAVNPAATTMIAKNVSAGTASHVLIILAAIQSWGIVHMLSPSRIIHQVQMDVQAQLATILPDMYVEQRQAFWMLVTHMIRAMVVVVLTGSWDVIQIFPATLPPFVPRLPVSAVMPAMTGQIYMQVQL